MSPTPRRATPKRTTLKKSALWWTPRPLRRWRDARDGPNPYTALLATADFVAFAERIETVATQGSVAAVASEKAIAEANEALPEGKRLVSNPAL